MKFDWLMPEPYFRRAFFFLTAGFVLCSVGLILSAIVAMVNIEIAQFLAVSSVGIWFVYNLLSLANICFGLSKQLKDEWNK